MVKKDWYKEGDYDSVMVIPATPGSALKKRYDQIVRGEGLKIRVVEKAGISIRKNVNNLTHSSLRNVLGQTASSALQGVMAPVL